MRYGHGVQPYSWVFVMELHHFSLHMELVMCMPAVVTLIISLPFNQVFEVIVPHLTVQDLLNKA
jgi:hypothetical protein